MICLLGLNFPFTDPEFAPLLLPVLEEVQFPTGCCPWPQLDHVDSSRLWTNTHLTETSLMKQLPSYKHNN